MSTTAPAPPAAPSSASSRDTVRAPAAAATEASSLRERIGHLLASSGETPDAETRGAILAACREHLAEGHDRAEAALAAASAARLAEGGDGPQDWGGRAASAALAEAMDGVVVALHAAARGAASGVTGETAARASVLAVGGYGRGRMAPGSDVDLLFLVPGARDGKAKKAAEACAEWVLYALWDLKLKVGHATRDAAECVELARTDPTIRTALLEARHICGDPAPAEAMVAAIYDDLGPAEASAFVSAKLAERDARHEREGGTRYMVEPNVKEGKGGQRDLQTLFWIAKAIHHVRTSDELVARGVFEPEEYASFVAADDFLWAVRCHMHLARGGRAEEVLSFDLQPEVARRMGFTGEGTGPDEAPGAGRAPVERFMRRYFTVAKSVGDLTRVLCADLEERHAKLPPGVVGRVGGLVRRLADPLRRRRLPGAADFVSIGGRIVLEEGARFADDPVRLIRLFHLADLHGLEPHPDTFKRVTRNLDLIDDAVRADAEANRLFLAILTSPRDPETALRRMSEAGVLGRFVPAFAAVTAMMQFSMYHRYTVDEHLIRTVGVCKEIADGDPKGLHPLAARLMPSMEDRDLLPVACFLHDIAKGRPEDHSVAGAAEARELCPRFGLDARQTETVAWLIEEHLTMSMVAQTRDLSDRRTIADLAARVQSVERLRLLLVLTVCDIRAVGPGVWNGWKGQLIRTLYHETEIVLRGGHAETAQPGRTRAAREALVTALVGEGWPGDEAAAHAARHYRPYLLSVPLDEQVRLARFVRAADADAPEGGARFASDARTDAFEGYTRLSILAADHPRLLTVIAGACAAAGANIVDAQINTMADGRALDVVTVAREFEREEDEMRRARRIGGLIRAMLAGETRLPAVMAERGRGAGRAAAFEVPPRVEVTNELSDRFTVIEIECRDRPGLLSDLARELSALNLDIASAHVTTFGEKVIDAFYVTDLMGGKIAGDMRRWRIRERLLAALRGERAGDLRRGSTAAHLAEHGA